VVAPCHALVPLPRSLDQRGENRPRAGVLMVAALGVPLYAEDEVLGGGVLYGLDNAIPRRMRDDAQAVARTPTA